MRARLKSITWRSSRDDCEHGGLTMTYFEDLSDYGFLDGSPLRLTLKRVGWLEVGHFFETMAPSDETLDLLWAHCKISLAQTRGFHQCDLCDPPRTVLASRGGPRLLLGTSEIRVFSDTSAFYAAPTLIYHYVRTHHYKPPDIFLHALRTPPSPPNPAYFDRLMGLTWRATSVHKNLPSYKFGNIDGESRRVEVEPPVFIDEF